MVFLFKKYGYELCTCVNKEILPVHNMTTSQCTRINYYLYNIFMNVGSKIIEQIQQI